MNFEARSGRRGFLRAAGVAGAGLALGGCRCIRGTLWAKGEKEGGGIAPTEDLMRDHGVVERVLLIYEEGVRRLDAREFLPPETISDAAILMRIFIEDYHEKQEESEVFPQIEKAGTLADVAAVLRVQHRAGRSLTDAIQQRLGRTEFNDPDSRRELANILRSFVRMCRPHYAREDTVLFPAFREILTARELDALGGRFEEREREFFGVGGFERIVAQVAQLEDALGLADLAQFTAEV